MAPNKSKAANANTSYGGPALRGNAKKKKGNQQPRRNKGNQNRMGGDTRVRRQLAMKLCGQVDPFCDMACCPMLSKNTMPTLSYSVKGVVKVTTDANGNGAAWVTPGVQSCLAIASTIDNATGIVTWAASTNTPEAASIAAAFYRYRVVCAGLHIYSSCNANESAGTVQTAQVRELIAGYDIFSLAYPEVHRERLYEYDQYIRFQQGGSAREEFQGITGAHSGTPGIFVSVTGAAATTTVLEIEYVFNVELLPDLGNFVSRMAKPAAPHVPGAESIVSNASLMVPTHTSSKAAASGGILKYIENAVNGIGLAEVAEMAGVILALV